MSPLKLAIKDLVFARKICNNRYLKYSDVKPAAQKNESLSARSVFVDIYSDVVMDIARSFNRDAYISSSTKPSLITIKGSSFPITDEIMDTYLWLMKEGFKKCCLFKGAAPLSHYIHTVLRSKFTRIDYIRHKTGVTTSIPKCIKSLSNSHQSIYMQLRQKKSRNYICQKFDINYIDYRLIKNEILEALFKAGNENYLIDTQTEEFSEDFHFKLGIESNEIQIIEKFSENIIPDVLKKLSKAEVRLMIEYWGRKNSVKSIFQMWSGGLFNKYLAELKIKTPKDFYKLIENILVKVQNLISESFPKENAEYPNIDIKSLLAEYFYNWGEEQELSEI